MDLSRKLVEKKKTERPSMVHFSRGDKGTDHGEKERECGGRKVALVRGTVRKHFYIRASVICV